VVLVLALDLLLLLLSLLLLLLPLPLLSPSSAPVLPPGPIPPLPPVTPPTSPQHSQHATRQHEHNSRIMSSPENCRTPAAPTTLNGQEYHNLPAHLAAQVAALPSFPAPQRRSCRSHGTAIAASSVSFNFYF
jgi:hypothetical protein